MKKRDFDAGNSEMESKDELKNLEKFAKRREKQKQVIKILLEQNNANKNK